MDTIVLSAEDADCACRQTAIFATRQSRASNEIASSSPVRCVSWARAGSSVISDIDDTVKITNVTDRRSLLEHTFLLDFIAAPGMSDFYGNWTTEVTGFHYVSSSPWQLYEPLREFLDANDFPWATFSLKTVRFRDETLLDLFRKGTETKPVAIKAILDRYPRRQFVLVGDSGEQDPEVYAHFLRDRPQQVVKVYIRNVTQEAPDNARFSAVFSGIDAERWELFEHPETIDAVQ